MHCVENTARNAHHGGVSGLATGITVRVYGLRNYLLVNLSSVERSGCLREIKGPSNILTNSWLEESKRKDLF